MTSWGRWLLVAGAALATARGAGSAGAAPEVVLATGAPSPAGLPYSRFGGVALGEGGHLAVLATTTGVFRVVHEDGVARAAGVFVPGGLLDSRVVVGADAPSQAPNGCVTARLGFSDGGGAIYRRCGAAAERVAGVGDALGADTLTTVEATVATSGGGYVAFLARLADGNTAVVRGGAGPLVEIARTGDPSPAGGTFSSLRVIGVRTNGTVGFAATVVDGRDGLFEGAGAAVRKVLAEGDDIELVVDGLPTLVPIDAIEGAAMNGDGVFAFVGQLDDDGGTRGVLVADARPVAPVVTFVAREDDPAPGVDGGIFSRFQPAAVPAINASGDVAFRVTLGGETTGAGIFVARAGGPIEKIVTTRDEVPVTPVAGEPEEETLTRLRDAALADDGSVVVVSTPPGEGVGLFAGRDGGLAELIRFGAAADAGSNTQRFRFVLPSVAGSAADAVVLGQHEALLAIDPAGGIRIVAQLGEATPVGGAFSELDLPAVGSDGRVAFRGEILDGKTGQGVFVDKGKGPKAIAKAGRPAPGPGRYRDFPATVSDGSASVDVAGTQVGFLASLFGTNAFEGIFLKRNGGAKSLARANARAPGGGRYVSVDVPSVVDARHFAFTGLVRDDATRQALFWRDGGQSRIVARQGLETGSRIGGRFQIFSPPDLSGGGLAFRAQLSPVGLDGLFLALGTRRGLLVGGGDVSDRADVFRAFDRPAWAGGSIAFSASLIGIPSLRGLFSLTPDGLPAPDAPQRPVTTLLRDGDDAPGGGRIVDVRPPVGNGGGTVASVVRVEGGPAEQVVVRIPASGP